WLASAGGYLFVGDASQGTVRRIDVRSGKAAGSAIRVASPAKDSPALVVVPSGGSIWAGSFASNTVTRVSATSRGNSALAGSATGACGSPTADRTPSRASTLRRTR